MRVLMLTFALAQIGVGASGHTVGLLKARDAEFGAQLLITADANSFYSQWNQPGTPSISTTKHVTRAQPIEAVIVFHDCTPAADGNCNVMVHFEVTAPDGQPYERPLERVAWKGPPAPEHALIASETTMGFILDPHDQLGSYTITATLTDSVSGKSTKISQSVTAIEGPTSH